MWQRDQLKKLLPRKFVKAIKPGKAPEFSAVYAKMVSTGGEIEIDMITKLFQKLLMTIFKGRDDAKNCGAAGACHKLVERRIHALVHIDEMQISFYAKQRNNRCILVVKGIHKNYEERGLHSHVLYGYIEGAR